MTSEVSDDRSWCCMIGADPEQWLRQLMKTAAGCRQEKLSFNFGLRANRSEVMSYLSSDLSRNYTLCLKKPDPVTFSNNSNNPGSVSTSYGIKNRQLIGTSYIVDIVSQIFCLISVLPIFDTLMTNAAVSYSRLWNSCSNYIVMHLHELSLLSA